MNAYSESTYLGDVLKCEAPNLYSRDTVTVLAGSGAERVLMAGAVIAARTRSEVTVTTGDGNTGNGEATLVDLALGALAEAGIYRLACITAGADGGTFQVLSPRGYVLPDLTVGTAYAGGHLNLTVPTAPPTSWWAIRSRSRYRATARWSRSIRPPSTARPKPSVSLPMT